MTFNLTSADQPVGLFHEALVRVTSAGDHVLSRASWSQLFGSSQNPELDVQIIFNFHRSARRCDGLNPEIGLPENRAAYIGVTRTRHRETDWFGRALQRQRAFRSPLPFSLFLNTRVIAYLIP